MPLFPLKSWKVKLLHLYVFYSYRVEVCVRWASNNRKRVNSVKHVWFSLGSNTFRRITDNIGSGAVILLGLISQIIITKVNYFAKWVLTVCISFCAPTRRRFERCFFSDWNESELKKVNWKKNTLRPHLITWERWIEIFSSFAPSCVGETSQPVVPLIDDERVRVRVRSHL